VHIYTSRGDTVVDLDDDPHLRHAATTAGRSYLATGQARPADLNPLASPVSLITLRWPRTTPGINSHLTDPLVSCRQLMGSDTSLVAAIRPADPDHPGSSFAEHAQALCVASDAAGLTHVLQIVAVSATGGGNQFLYYATETEAVQLATEATTHGDQVLHLDLLVFAVGGGPA
jgi:hypothetical protein